MAHILDQKIRSFKLKIPEFKKMSKTDSDRSWEVLEDAISQILTLNVKYLSFEQIYRTVYSMVLYRCGEVVYRGFVNMMARHLQRIATTLEAVPGSLFLEELNRRWTSYIQSLQIIEDIFFHVDRTYFRPVAKTSTFLMGMNFWKQHLITTPEVRGRLLPALLDLVLRERMGEEKVQGLMSKIIKMLEDLGLYVYDDIFEKPLLDATAAVYRFQSKMAPHELGDCAEYLSMAERTLSEEIKRERVAMCVESRSGPKVTAAVTTEMICNYMLKLVDMVMPDLVLMLVGDKYDDLARTYAFFQFVPGGVAIVCTAMYTHLRATGKYLVADPERLENHVNFVQRLIDQQDKYDKVIRLSVKNDITFQNALSAAMETFVNSSKWAAESISLYMDDKLRKAADLKQVNTTDVEILDKVMMLIPYLHDKDVLKKNYRTNLAKRLLSGGAVSHKMESILISKLKAEFGYPYTSKLERMLTDMETSDDIMEGFTSNLLSGHDSVKESNFSVSVLTSASWPTQPMQICNLPSEILSLQHEFETHYYSAHSGRRLTWLPNIRSAELKANFGFGKEHELHVSTYQTCILMLFNTKDCLTYEEIQQTTGIRCHDLTRELHSLACVKGKNVLRKEPISKDIGKADVFMFNDGFSSKLYKIKIWNVGAQKLMETKRKYTRERVQFDRRPQIEAAIVRVMKSRQILDHKNLVTQVTEHLKSSFVANPPEIKKGIEALIGKEFLERDKDETQSYRYVA
ncbi:hypothetical protein O6H91_18G019400 [Diphasiastrum complanatum]|uniref:Uncharacterized protein n=1 Tax=Diphasiastrum complanatum TaxID=34168 RepID=A0ACC2AYI6_DIPCM|nr:hypothetical protein O6H91_18G019400 [Diphasiastrum complanatum]